MTSQSMVERRTNHTGRVNCPFDGNLTGLCLFTVFYSVCLTVFKPSERPVSWPVMWETQFDAVAHNVWHQIKWIIDTSIYRNVCKDVFFISLILDFLFCVRGELVSMTNVRIRSQKWCPLTRLFLPTLLRIHVTWHVSNILPYLRTS